MKTNVLQSLFKIALLLFGIAVGFGCDNSDEWESGGMEISCKLVKIVENSVEVEIPEKLLNAPRACVLYLNTDKSFQGSGPVNEIYGEYMLNSISGKININILFMTELASSIYGDFENLYLSFLGNATSYKQEGEYFKFYFGKDSYLQYKSIERIDL